MRRLVATLAGVLAFSAAVPALAQAPQTVGIRLVDVPTSRTHDPRARQYIVDHLKPGTTITRRIEISNDTAKPQVVKLYAAAATIAKGSMVFGDGRAANDLTTWTSVTPPTVTPAAGRKALATVKIVVPANASPGERYAVVWAELAAAAPAGGGVTVVNRVGVRMYLSIGPGGDPASDFKITALQARRAADGSPLVAASVRNTGGRAVDLSGDLRLTNGPGGLSAGPFPAKLGTTLGVGQAESVLVPLDKAIPVGPWDAHIVLHSGTTQRDATARVTFPRDARTAASPVKTQSDSSPWWRSPIVLGVAALILFSLLGLLVLLAQRRRRRPPVRNAAHAAA